MKHLIILLIGVAIGFNMSELIPEISLLMINKSLLLLSLTLLLSSFIWRRFSDQNLAYINNALKEASKKNRKISQYRYKWRFRKLWKKINRICELNSEIISTIRQFPDRFQIADKFFSLYLDSVQNILSRDETLRTQSVRSTEIRRSLAETERMLNEIINRLEGQLSDLLKNDIKELELEREVLEYYGGKN